MASDAAQGQSGGLLRSLLHQRLQRRQQPTEQGVAERLHGLLGERQGHGGTMGEGWGKIFGRTGTKFFGWELRKNWGSEVGFTTKNGGGLPRKMEGDEQNWDLSSVEVWKLHWEWFCRVPICCQNIKMLKQRFITIFTVKKAVIAFFISVQTPLVIMATRATPLKFLFRCPSRVQSRCELQTHCITLSYASWSLWHSYHVNLHGYPQPYVVRLVQWRSISMVTGQRLMHHVVSCTNVLTKPKDCRIGMGIGLWSTPRCGQVTRNYWDNGKS